MKNYVVIPKEIKAKNKMKFGLEMNDFMFLLFGFNLYLILIKYVPNFYKFIFSIVYFIFVVILIIKSPTNQNRKNYKVFLNYIKFVLHKRKKKNYD